MVVGGRSDDGYGTWAETLPLSVGMVQGQLWGEVLLLPLLIGILQR
jgi:hypothetical protein